MVLWYNMLDVATFNSYTNFTAQHPDYMDGASSERQLFIKELGKELIMPPYEEAQGWHTNSRSI